MSEEKLTREVFSKDLLGQTVVIDDRRLVFVGSVPSHPTTLLVGFINSKGRPTRLAMSHEAAIALRDLLTTHIDGTGAREALPAPLVYTPRAPAHPAHIKARVWTASVVSSGSDFPEETPRNDS
mgnify:CR=1 FL=1